MSEFVDKKIRVGLFDSGIGGFSILSELFKTLSSADYFYYSDDANAPYGPKSDEFITQRSIYISEELFKKQVDIIVIACNTATAASIDQLRLKYPERIFVGVEPYLNAYYKMPSGEKKVAVLTTESTGKSQRFKRLKERLDPEGNIELIPLPHMARLIEDRYYKRIDSADFKGQIKAELHPLLDKKFTHIILGCTHYPLIASLIDNILGGQSISPCRYVAGRVVDLLQVKNNENNSKNVFNFCSSKNNNWVEMNRSDLLSTFKD